MASSQQDIDATKSVLDTEITGIKQEISLVRAAISERTSDIDFQKLQQTLVNDLAKVSKMFDDFGDQFNQHVTGPHNEISARLAALEREAITANAQRLELQQRLQKTEASMQSGSTNSIPGDRLIQGAKLTAVYDQENGKISFSDWSTS